MENVQVRPSSLQLYAVARSFSNPMSAVVVSSVDWISGSCTCSPQPQETNGSNPAAGSLLAGIDTVTCAACSSGFEPAAEPASDDPPAHALNTPPKPSAAALTPATFTNVRLETAPIPIPFSKRTKAHNVCDFIVRPIRCYAYSFRNTLYQAHAPIGVTNTKFVTFSRANGNTCKRKAANRSQLDQAALPLGNLRHLPCFQDSQQGGLV